MGKQKKGNPEKLTTEGTQEEEVQSKNTTLYVLDITMRKQTGIQTNPFIIENILLL
jgi:hypothetical protein